MFKSWQVFLFSLVPLTLIFAGVISSSFYSDDSAREVFPTPAPQPTLTGSSGATSGGGGSGATLSITARDSSFNRRTLTAPPNTSVSISFDNQDAGVLHNVAVYTNNRATSSIFVGELTTGPRTTTYTFNTPGPGTYFFRCDSHPDTMTGTFNVR